MLDSLFPLDLTRYFPVAVWLEFMLPLLALRNYSKFVVDYLKSLLKLHNAPSLGKVAKGQDGSR